MPRGGMHLSHQRLLHLLSENSLIYQHLRGYFRASCSSLEGGIPNMAYNILVQRTGNDVGHHGYNKDSNDL